MRPTLSTDVLDSTLVLNTLTSFNEGNFGARLPVDSTGTVGKVHDALNQMFQRMEHMASEFARINRVVGKEGRISERASLGPVSGGWAQCVDAVNGLIADFVQPSTEVARVIGAVAKGDLTQTMELEVDGRPLKGEFLHSARVVNAMVDQLNWFVSEVTRVAREVGSEGKLGGQANVKSVAGVWKDLTDSVNSMAGNLTAQVRNIAEVTTAVANGDLSRKITVDVQGEILELKNTINTMVDQLSSFASEVTRVAREVGTEGKLGGQATVGGVAGVWKDLTDSVNSMAGNLTAQVRNIAEVTTAVATGDLSRKITVNVQGEILELKNTINTMVDQLNAFASEVTRVAREVGTEGILGGQADVRGVAGVWKDLTDSVNSMASNLTAQVRNIAEVTTAVAKGDLSRKITVHVRGEILELTNTINTMMDQLSSFASEVTRVAREVGTEGKLGGQAEVKGVAGTWKDLTESVNWMAGNLTNQVRNIASVTTAVAKGDLSTKITVDARGEIQELKNTINTMVDQLNSFASEVTRVAREVGTEGKLGGQADVRGVAGTWKDLTDSVNSMAGNLTAQVRNIAEVTTAVAKGDLGRKITVDVHGEILELKNTVNTMVDQLGSFASEVTRVAREVGTEGKLGGQAEVRGIAGTWKDLTDSVNSMASNLTNQVRNIAQVTTAVANGDLSWKITVDVRGEISELKNTINRMVDQLNGFASEVTRVAREVGTEGKLGGQAYVPGVAGTWKDLTDSVNYMASNLTNQVRNIAQVTTAVANGDLSRKITVDVQGEILELKNTINTMVDQLNSFASEVTRVAREVGTEGKLGGQAKAKGVAGTWKDLTENVNSMAANLTTQVRGIAKVVTGVANGDLKRKLVLETKGEIADLAHTINDMIDTLATFADQVTTVAREVGVEGKLGGQARVPGAAGIWRDLTDNVNQLAANLTGQVRAIADVANAVTSGDLTRTISVEAKGEVAALKDNINEMIRTLARTTRQNQEQDWLKTNIAKFTGMLQGQRDLTSVAKLLLAELSPVVQAQCGTVYVADEDNTLKLLASYAPDDGIGPLQVKMGQGVVGQCALEKRRMLITSVPRDYIKIASSLGEAAPATIVVLPVLFEGQAKAVIELASLGAFNDIDLALLDQITQSLGIVLNTIAATMRTEELLKQSQALAEQLQTTNAELEEKAHLLAEQKTEVEAKNQEVEQAKAALEEKAEQLATTSEYKSEFLANMSHELRTPLNNVLLIAETLASNPEKNLTPRQIKYAETIHSSGTDLLALINDILDLSKIESGKMDLEIGEVRFADLRDYCARTFKHVADGRGLELGVHVNRSLLTEALRTDAKRLQQILKNLLSNALKFTERGTVNLRIERAPSGWRTEHPVLSAAKSVVAFSVSDTGIGISRDKQRLIFEAFQQSDGTTSRKYGGTGLGLSISREIARLLGGEIHLTSEPGVGSTFTLYLPDSYLPTSLKPEQIDPVFLPDRGTDADAQSSGEKLPLDSVVTMRSADTALEESIEDDRDAISPDDRLLLIIDNDPKFGRTLLELAHDRNLKAIIALHGRTGLSLARECKPSAIILDDGLFDVTAWSVLDGLKHDPETRHVPVHVMTADENRRLALTLGAITIIEKPVRRESLVEAFAVVEHSAMAREKALLVVSVDQDRREQLRSLLGGADIEIMASASCAEAVELIRRVPTDMIIIDLPFIDMVITDLVEQIEKDTGSQSPSVVLYGSGEAVDPEALHLSSLSRRSVVRLARSPERLVYEATLLLHRREADLPDVQRKLMAQVERPEASLAGTKVLIVDDDVRTIFALTSVLEQHHLSVLHAESGHAGIELLKKTTTVDVVLMDIMMPEMDGYKTIGAIRQLPEFQDLPIIAVTAKAMKGDREKCIAAGASEYIAKPVDVRQLFSLMRVSLSRRSDGIRSALEAGA